MSVCSACRNSNPDGQRFCGSCGTATDATSPSAFEIGRIAALDSVKTAILSWLGIPASIIIGLVAVFGYFGVTGLVGTTVEKEVQVQIEHETKTLQEKTQGALADIFTKIGEANINQQAILKLLDKTNADLTVTQNIENQLNAKIAETQKEKIALDATIRETEETKSKLEKAISDLNISAFIVKLKYDFYHIHDFTARAHIDFDSSLSRSQIDYPHGYAISVLAADDSVSNTQGAKPSSHIVAELNGDDETNLSDNDMVVGKNISYTLFSPYESKIMSHRIDEFSSLDKIWIRFSTRADTLELQKNLMKHIKSIDISILVNWRPVWRFTITQDHMKLISGNIVNGLDDEFFEYSFDPLKERLIPIYESLFNE
jgi:hypothetical protein